MAHIQVTIMPEFMNPFTGIVPGRMLTKEELLRAVRLNIAAEQEAINTYLSHADATDNALAKAVFIDIANEERTHAAEFARLLALLTDEDQYTAQGAREVNELAAQITTGPAKAAPENESTTVGSLKKYE